jgi:hypothetical protein
MHKRLVAVALEAVVIPALGLAAYGIAHSVSDSPKPQVILPAVSSATTAAPRRAGNDGGIHTSTTQTTPGRHEQVIHSPAAATKAGHHPGDDHGVDTPTVQSAPDNDAGDDHGADRFSTAPAAATAGVTDEHGGTAVTANQVSGPEPPAPVAPTTSVADSRGSRSGGGGSHDAPGPH